MITLPGYWYNETDLPRIHLFRIYVYFFINSLSCNNHLNLRNEDILYKCPDKACIGNNTCASNHEGIVCAVCSDGFYNWGAGCKGILTTSLLSPFTHSPSSTAPSPSSSLPPLIAFFLSLCESKWSRRLPRCPRRNCTYHMVPKSR